MFRPTLLGSAAAFLAISPVHAQDQAPPAPTPAEQHADEQANQDSVPATRTQPADFHQTDGQEIVITGFRRPRGDVLSGTSVITAEELTRELRPTIGETLARQAGVSATSFGPNASRPVLRGQQGERVRVLTDGIGSLDASSTSADHAVAINPLTAERIEVLRGPAALLFGSAAIGGVVNVIDARIPRRVPDEPAHIEGILTYGSAANERSANGTIDVPVAGHFVFHFDGNYSKTDDLEIGGYVLSRERRLEAAASPDPAIRALADLKGRLPNSGGRTTDLAAGAAWIDGENNVGFSVNRYDSLYGIPVRYSLDPTIEAERTRIDVKQDRFDGRAEIDLGIGFLDTVRFRAGHADYRHNELEENGDIGTTFLNKGLEGRLEFVQSTRKGWGGGFGAQYFQRKLNIIGDEKFLPRSETKQIGLFTLQSIDLGALRAEAGARYEHTDVRADPDLTLGNSRMNRKFDAYSGSVGASFGLGSGVRIGVNGSHSQRAPSAEELFANGPHAGTQAFESGDPNLKKEKSWGLEGTIHGTGQGYSFGASVYHSWFNNYIYQARTSGFLDELPIFQNRQANARYFGVEFEGSTHLFNVGKFDIVADAVADYVQATIRDQGPAPRIPPFRLLGGIEAQSDTAQARLEVERVSAQERLAQLESRTGGYTMVNASVSFKPFKDNASSILLSANNIFDVDARRHASFLKDFAPLAGRDLRVTARIAF